MRGITFDDKYLLLLWNKMEYFKKHFIYPSQDTLVKWMRNQGGLEITRRTLNRHMRRLQKSQLIHRIRRVKRRPMGGMEFATTLYSIGFLGLKRLQMLGVIGVEKVKEYLKNSMPFKKRLPKKEKKGITPGDLGFLKDWTNLEDGYPVQE